MRHTSVAPALALALLSVIWGYNWVAMKVGLSYAGPFTFATLRFLIGPLCLVPRMVKLGQPLVPSREQWKPVLILGSMLAVNFAATFIALQLGGTGKTAVLVYTMPFWVLVFARLALHERLNRLQVLAVIFALAGLTWLVESWNLQGGVLATPVIGVLAAWIHLGDRPTPTEALGMALVAVGLALLAWAGLRVKPTA